MHMANEVDQCSLIRVYGVAANDVDSCPNCISRILQFNVTSVASIPIRQSSRLAKDPKRFLMLSLLRSTAHLRSSTPRGRNTFFTKLVPKVVVFISASLFGDSDGESILGHCETGRKREGFIPCHYTSR